MMAIYKLLQNTPLGPEEINRLTTAYEQTLKALSLKDRSDPLTQLIARKIFEIGQTGIEDPADISKLRDEAGWYSVGRLSWRPLRYRRTSNQSFF